MYLQISYFLSVVVHSLDELSCCAAYRTHSYDDSVRVFSSVIVEDVVFSSRELAHLTHILFNNIRERVIIRVVRLSDLEIHIRVLNCGSHFRIFRIDGIVPELLERFLVDQLREVLIIYGFYFLYLMRCSESVHEMQHRDPCLYGRQMCDCGEIHDFLDTAR